MKINIYILCVIGLCVLSEGHVYSQVRSNSQRGLLFPEVFRPNLEVKVVSHQGRSNALFGGANTMLDLYVFNTGNFVAEQCWLRVDTDSPFVIPRITHVDLFSLEPGDSVLISVPVYVSDNMRDGNVRLTIGIEEAQGYHLHPPRTIHYFITEKPDFDLVVIDVATRDQRGVGYFDKFEEVELYFRVQNCAAYTINNVSARMDMMDGTIPVSVNPRLELGNLSPGETRDVQARVSTGMVARHVGVSLKLEADETNYSQEFLLNFLTDYSAPDEMKVDGCAEFVPELTDELVDGLAFEPLSPRAPRDNHFAIIISNQNYFMQPELEHAYQDSELFIRLLQDFLGYRRENIFVFSDIRRNQMMNLLQSSGQEGQRFNRALRRAGRNKELTIFYVGHGAVDLVNGETYIMPVNFVNNDLTQLVSLSEFYNSLLHLKAQFDITTFTCFLNINNLYVTQTGKHTEQQMPHVEFHRRNAGFTTFISSPVKHTSSVCEKDQVSQFVKYLISGLEGRADLNNNRSVSARELHQFMTDEFFGIPARVWEQNQTFQVPILLGEDRIIY